MPEAHVEVVEAKSPFGGAYANFGASFGSPYGKSRFDEDAMPFRSSYDTPGWQRAKAQTAGPSAGAGSGKATAGRGPVSGKLGPGSAARRGGAPTIDGEIIASSSAPGAGFVKGDRVRHERFGSGTVTAVDGNKLTIAFDSGETKRVVESFVERG